MNKLRFLKILFSPFKPFRLKWYAGKIKMGTPYFIPRVWTNNPNKPGYMTARPRKIGFDFVSLGWKTKYDSVRFEWSPMLSFVIFNRQIAVTAVAEDRDHYWECWIAYEYYTDKSTSKKERIAKAREEHSQIWSTTKDGVSVSINYWNRSLKKRWLDKSTIQNRGLTS
jgi:hypothetical protein